MDVHGFLVAAANGTASFRISKLVFDPRHGVYLVLDRTAARTNRLLALSHHTVVSRRQETFSRLPAQGQTVYSNTSVRRSPYRPHRSRQRRLGRQILSFRPPNSVWGQRECTGFVGRHRIP